MATATTARTLELADGVWQERPNLKLVTPEVRILRTFEPVAPAFYVKRKWLPEELEDLIRHYDPKTDLGRLIRTLGGLKHIDANIRGELLYHVQRMVVIESCLTGIKYDGLRQEYEYLGVLSRHQIVDNGVGFLVDAWQNSVELENMKYHGFGTGTTAESSSQTALTTEFTTEYVSNIRPTGSLTEGATGNIFRSVGTFAPDSGGSLGVQEHGLFSASSAGVLWDRSLTGTVTVNSANSDSLQVTYDATFSSGG